MNKKGKNGSRPQRSREQMQTALRDASFRSRADTSVVVFQDSEPVRRAKKGPLEELVRLTEEGQPLPDELRQTLIHSPHINFRQIAEAVNTGLTLYQIGLDTGKIPPRGKEL